ncbi:OLC1v1005182C2 [Oldenlandia corymbosa var. corymbosa]|uniref:OLC1v1005182C2 n=1 Tax=Oldenlandia corymbosa var. corymbosa TaxID=529605 RepID=A0AAV1DES7_OLDCO|nr:OLC1v1005182C2 [Oldenlandia corymbosa var. corymbosa]
MAEDSKKENGDVDTKVPSTSSDPEVKKEKTKKKKGVFSRVWNAVFRSQGDDFEKRLQHITKEEASVLSRMRRRSQSWKRIRRDFIVMSVLLEAIAVGYAIMTTRALELDWRMRALRVLPMFLLPALSFLTFSAFSSFNTMRDRKDQKTLERLRTERQNKIDELKEKTNYYITQQLIQRYDPDPAAKAAAASVLASKLGADSGLKVYLGDESKLNAPVGKSSDVELVPSSGLRNRKQVQTRANGSDHTVLDHHEEEMLHQTGLEGLDVSQHQQLVVEHHQQSGSTSQDGGWLARVAALLVGEDPTQSYALICGNCHMHNGKGKASMS